MKKRNANLTAATEAIEPALAHFLETPNRQALNNLVETIKKTEKNLRPEFPVTRTVIDNPLAHLEFIVEGLKQKRFEDVEVHNWYHLVNTLEILAIMMRDRADENKPASDPSPKLKQTEGLIVGALDLGAELTIPELFEKLEQLAKRQRGL